MLAYNLGNKNYIRCSCVDNFIAYEKGLRSSGVMLKTREDLIYTAAKA
jgi:hypothetical protein